MCPTYLTNICVGYMLLRIIYSIQYIIKIDTQNLVNFSAFIIIRIYLYHDMMLLLTSPHTVACSS